MNRKKPVRAMMTFLPTEEFSNVVTLFMDQFRCEKMCEPKCGRTAQGSEETKNERLQIKEDE